jgi:hypothetical protein
VFCLVQVGLEKETVRVWFCNRRQTERKLQNNLSAYPTGIAATLASLDEAQNGGGISDGLTYHQTADATPYRDNLLP